MKNIVIISSLLLSFFILDATTVPTDTENESSEYIQRSEIRFCESRGYNPDNMTDDQINEFLDCWRGSVEEENAMSEF